MKKIYLLFLVLALASVLELRSQDGMAVSTTGADPDASAILDLISTDKGLLIPRMSTAQRDAINSGTFATGLTIYNTDLDQFQYWDGVQWVTIIGGGLSGTATAGQVAFYTGANTLAGNNSFIWDNANGRLGLGIASPNYILDVDGTVNIGTSDADGFLRLMAGTSSGDYAVTVAPSAAATTNTTFTLPPDAGATGNVLITDGSGNTFWADSASLKASTIAVTGPNDGLLFNDNGVITTANNITIDGSEGNISLNWLQADSVSAATFVGGDYYGQYAQFDSLQVGDGDTQGMLNLQDGNGEGISFFADSNMNASYTLTWPLDDGDPNEFLMTDGNGVLSWEPVNLTAGNVTVNGDPGGLLYNNNDTIGTSANITLDDATGRLSASSFEGDTLIANLGIIDTLDSDIADITTLTSNAITAQAISTDTINASVGNIDTLYLGDATTQGRLALNDGNGESLTLLANPDMTSSYTLMWPFDAGNSGQVLTTNGADSLYWSDMSLTAGNVTVNGGQGGLLYNNNDTIGTTANITLDDSTGELSAQILSSDSIAVTNGNITNLTSDQITADSVTANAFIGGDYYGDTAQFDSLSLGDGSTPGVLNMQAGNGNGFNLYANPDMTSSYSLSWPFDAGTSGQVLTTNGSDSLYWSTINGTVSNSGANGGIVYNNNGTLESATTITMDDGAGSINASSFVGDTLIANLGIIDTVDSDIADITTLTSNSITAQAISTDTINASVGNIDTLYLGDATTQGRLALNDGNGESLTLLANPDMTSSYSLMWPFDAGMNGQVLTTNGSDSLYWSDMSLTAGNVTVNGGQGGLLYNNNDTIGTTANITLDDAAGRLTASSFEGDTLIANLGIIDTLDTDIADITTLTSNSITAQAISTDTINASVGNIDTLYLGDATTQGRLALNDGNGESLTLLANPDMTSSYSLMWPFDAGTSGQVLTTNGSDSLYWSDMSLTAGNVTVNGGQGGLLYNNNDTIGTTANITLDDAAGRLSASSFEADTLIANLGIIDTLDTDIADITALTSDNITTNLFTGDSVTANTFLGGDIYGDTAQFDSLSLGDGSTPGILNMQAGNGNGFNLYANPDMTSSYSLSWPFDAGTSGQVLTTNGSDSLYWSDMSLTAGNVTVNGGQGGLLYNNNDTIGTSANITLDDAAGRLTASSFEADTLIANLGIIDTLDTDIADITTLTSNAITAQAISTDTINASVGNIDTLYLGDATTQGRLALNDGNGESLTLLANPDMTSSYSLMWPFDAGTSGQVLTTNGSDSLYWSDMSLTAGNVTVNGGQGGLLYNNNDTIGTTANITLDDAAGRLTASSFEADTLIANLGIIDTLDSDIANITALTSDNITTNLFTGDSVTANTFLGGDIYGDTAQFDSLSLGDGSTPGVLNVQAGNGNGFNLYANPDMTGSYSLTWPFDAGTDGQILTTNGSDSLYWSNLTQANVSVTGTNGGLLYNDNGDMATTTTITLDNTTGALNANTLDLGDGTTSGALTLNDNNGGEGLTFAVSDMASDYTLTWPAGLGTNGQVLTTDASGNLSWSTPSSTGGDISLWTDNGALLYNLNDTIAEATNLSLDNATGSMTLGAEGQDGGLTIYSEQGATDYSVILQPNAAMTETTTYTLPADNGNANEVLTTDGNGALSWGNLDQGNIDVAGTNGGLLYNDNGDMSTTTTITLDNTTGALNANTLDLGDGTTSGALTLNDNNGGQGLTFAVSDMASDYTLTWPAGLGTNGQVLTTDASGNLSWSTPSSTGGDISLWTDNGALLYNLNDTIAEATNLSLDNATGSMTLGADGQDGGLTIYSEQGATDYSVILQPNATMTETTTYTLPADNGNANEVLTTDGNGALSWGNLGQGNIDVTGTNGGLLYNDNGDMSTTTTITLDNTTGALNANTLDLGDGTTSGALTLNDNNGGEGLTFAVQDMASDYTLTWPAGLGTNGQVLTTDASGNLSWSTPSSTGGDITLWTDNGALLYNLNDTIAEATNLSLDNATGGLTLGSASQSGTLGITDGNGNTLNIVAGDNMTGDVTLTFPDGAGTNGQVLTTDGNGDLSWGNLDQGNIDVTGINGGLLYNDNGDMATTTTITLDNTTGALNANTLDLGDGTTSGALTLNDNNGGEGLTFAVQDMASDYTLTWPAGLGTNGQVLTTDASGNLSWSTPSSTGGDITLWTDNGALLYNLNDTIAEATNLSLDNATGGLTLGSASQSGTLGITDGSGNTLNIVAGGAMGGNVTLTFPSDDGDANEYLRTDGSGALTWEPLSVTSSNVSLTGNDGGLLYNLNDTIASTSNILLDDAAGRLNSQSVEADTLVANRGEIDTLTSVTADITSLTTDNITTNLITADTLSSYNINSQNADIDTLTLGAASGPGGFMTMYDGDGQSISFNTQNITSSYTLSWPTGLGTAGQVLTTDASGNLSWTSPGSSSLKGDGVAGRLTFWGGTDSIDEATDIYVDKANSRLGIGSASSTPAYALDVTGTISSGNEGADGQFRLYSEQGATDFSVLINPNVAMTQDVTYTLPPDDGDADEVLTTDGAGNLSWTAAGGGSTVYDIASESVYSASQNNLALTANNTVYRLSSSGNIDITGFDASVFEDGALITIINVGNNNIRLRNENNGSSPANQIITGGGGNSTLAPNGVATLIYDGTSQRWRIISNN